MKLANIHFLDLDPASGSGPIIRQILTSSRNPKVQLSTDSSETSASSALASRVLALSRRSDVDLIFLTLPADSTAILQALQALKSDSKTLPPMIAVLQQAKTDDVIHLLKAGIVDFITPPFKEIDILPRVWRLLTRAETGDPLVRSLKEKIGLQLLVGKNAAFLSEIEKIPLIANSNATVLICGETGTGKELCARAVHYLGMRSGYPFVPMNCGTIPNELVENELFGHLKGAYTGAHASQTGLIREADGGTLFLDEIECLPFSSQVKLLRFLQEKEYRQLGSAQLIRSDARVIAATNIRLDLAAREGTFRRDLYYRLNIIPLSIPPLRERKDDIPLLAHHFLKKHASETERECTGFSPEALQKLMLYDWPGNVRELENVIERTLVFSKKAHLTAETLMLPQTRESGSIDSFRAAKAKVVERFERDYLHSILLAHAGNISKASSAAGKNRRAFWELIRKYGIVAQDFRPPRF
jgi:two-component system, NtrC family, response regulator GlrR